jgi:hypothetical protein
VHSLQLGGVQEGLQLVLGMTGIVFSRCAIPIADFPCNENMLVVPFTCAPFTSRGAEHAAGLARVITGMLIVRKASN